MTATKLLGVGMPVSPQYAAWCRSAGLPEANHVQRNHEFIRWVDARWREWGRPDGRVPTDLERAEFAAWLQERFPPPAAPTAD